MQKLTFIARENPNASSTSELNTGVYEVSVYKLLANGKMQGLKKYVDDRR